MSDVLVLTSNEDIASMNIREHLLQQAEWQPEGTFDGNPALRNGQFLMVEINEIHLFYDFIGKKANEQLGIKLDLIVVASRHRSKTGLRTLTIHPLGNFSSADFGGQSGKLVPTAPRQMTHALLELKSKASHLDFAISFEATHHGPYLETPLFFIEIGSDEGAWPEKEPAKAIAEVILSLAGPLRTEGDIVAIGIGGGHYMPRISDVASTHKISFGHMVPSYALESLDADMVRQAMAKTPGVEGVYFHRKGMSKPKLRELRELCGELDLPVLSSKEIPER